MKFITKLIIKMPHQLLAKNTIYIISDSVIIVIKNIISMIGDSHIQDNKHTIRFYVDKEYYYMETLPTKQIQELRFLQIKSLIDHDYTSYTELTQQLRNAMTPEQLIQYSYMFK